MTYRRIRLELARDPTHPHGSHRDSYEFVLPLDDAGHLDRALFDKAPELCTVHRSRENEDDAVGQLMRSGRDRWSFSFALNGDNNEPIARFAEHLFREGEYMTIHGPNGDELTFKIVLNVPAPGLANERPH